MNLLLFNNSNTNNIINDFQRYKEMILEEYRKIEIKQLYDHIPMNGEHLIYLINTCNEYGVDPDLVLAIIWTESKFNPMAKNKKSSARGYGQFIKSTANSIANMLPEIQNYNHNVDAHDPYINIKMTVHYISILLNKSGNNLNKALQGYRGCNDKKYFKLIAQRREFIKKNKEK